jgi:hypothetical protein
MPLASDRHVNEKPFEIGINSQNPPVLTHSVGRRPEFIWCNAPQNTSVNLMSASRADLKSVISGCLAMQKKK